MGRTITEIQQSIFDAKNAETELDDLNSSSSTAIWRVWTYITAVVIFAHEAIFDAFKVEVNNTLDAKRPATGSWYVSRSKEFQLGDDVVVSADGAVGYATVDTTKQIVTRAAFKEASGTLTLKVAKGTTAPEPLASEELTQFEAYLAKIKYAGTDLNITSLAANELRLTAEIFFDGIYAEADIQTAVEAALNEYMANLPFNGNLVLNDVIDKIQGVTGVIDPVVSTMIITDAGGGNPSSNITRQIELPAGYIVEAYTGSNAFSDLLTYTAE